MHRPMRSFVSVLGIALGVFLIISTIGLADGTLRGNAQREANVGAEIMVRASGTFGLSGSEPLRLPVSRALGLAAVEGVKMAVPIGQNLDAADDSETGTRLIDGVHYGEYAKIAGLRIVDGRELVESGNEAVIDTAWQAQKKLKIGSTLRIYEKDFTVVGTYEPASGARIKIPLAEMQNSLAGDARYCTTILVKVDDPAQQDEIATRIQAKYPDDQIIMTRDFEELYLGAIPAIDIFLDVVVAIAAIIGILVVLLTMYTSVAERTKQIGVLKSLGMSKPAIAFLITKEALLISLAGGVVGMILSVPLPLILTQTDSSMRFTFEIKWILLTLAGGLAGGAIGAIYPAVRAARMDAVDALACE
ncbi:MAG: ABC transporter permease [Pyrinomonadaceae bacterium]